MGRKLEGITFSNFRDLGGLGVGDGKMIARGKIFRAGKLRPKTEEDRAFLKGLALDTVVDLRIPAEVREKPDELPAGFALQADDALLHGRGV